MRESEARLRAFAENASQAMCLKDTGGRYLIANRLAGKRAGLRPGDMLGKTNLELGRWKDDEMRLKIDDHEQAVIDSGTAVIRERTEIEADGSISNLLIHKFPVLDSEGKVVAVGTINTDITRQLAVERELRDSHQRAEASSDWFWELDEALRFTHSSKLDTRSSGASHLGALDFIRQSSKQPDVAANPEQWAVFWDNLDTHQPIRNLELPIRDDTGQQRYLRASAKPHFDGDGAFLGYRGVAADVTEFVESQLQTNRLRDAIEDSTDAVALYDKDDKIVFTNDAYHSAFPHTPDKRAIVGLTHAEILEHDLEADFRIERSALQDRCEFVQHMLKLFRERKPETDEITYATGRTYLRRKRPLEDGGALIHYTDISEQKRAEQALRDSHQRFQDFAEASSDWFWELDEALHFTHLSKPTTGQISFEGLEDLNLTRFGGNPDDVAARPEKWRRFWNDLKTHQPVRNFECPLRDETGRLRHVRASAKPRFDENGTFLGYRGVASDVTAMVESQVQANRLRDAIDSSPDIVAPCDREQRIVFTIAQTDFAPQVEEIRDLVSQSIRQVRTLMAELSPPMLYELGLEPALEWLTSHFRTRYQLECEMCSPDAVATLSTDSKVALFQCARELLMNIVKHADTTQAVLSVRHDSNTFSLQVEDDGVGLDLETAGKTPSTSGGFGLFSLRERIGLLDGELSIESHPGTRVRITIPL